MTEQIQRYRNAQKQVEATAHALLDTLGLSTPSWAYSEAMALKEALAVLTLARAAVETEANRAN